MNSVIAFVGDLHGNLRALHRARKLLLDSPISHTVFLGDYINKGPDSAQVLETLIDMHAQGATSLLLGNHERALLTALQTGELAPFLLIGGARTIRSYVSPVGPDVLSDLRASMPQTHIEALRRMPGSFATDQLVASHEPAVDRDGRYLISAHMPVGLLPHIDSQWAQLDTGCGEGGGRLTLFFWPSRRFTQIDEYGELVGGFPCVGGSH